LLDISKGGVVSAFPSDLQAEIETKIIRKDKIKTNILLNINANILIYWERGGELFEILRKKTIRQLNKNVFGTECKKGS
jgi:hypothetical protein